MRIFFDNCTSPILARVMHAYLSASGGSAHHIRDMAEYGFHASTSDTEWMTRLADDRPADWLVVTGDGRIRRNKAERTAWKRSRLKGFVLARGFQKTPTHQVAALLLWRWPEMESFIASPRPARSSSFRSAAPAVSCR